MFSKICILLISKDTHHLYLKWVIYVEEISWVLPFSNPFRRFSDQ